MSPINCGGPGLIQALWLAINVWDATSADFLAASADSLAELADCARYYLGPPEKTDLNVSDQSKYDVSNNKPKRENGDRVREKKINEPAKGMFFYLRVFICGLSRRLLFVWIRGGEDE